jgi:glycosyltransferase involved in cell wall biosynthesis
MINPCAVKGISIFLELARRFPEIPFDALRGWGTTPEDEARMAALSNVTLLESVADIEEFLARGSVLLMPSLWYEGFGLIVMEAMLRGIPVIASDSGGLLEAKAGTGYVIPVRPLEGYRMEFDAAHMPRPVIPPQDIGPWEAALGKLLEDEDEYRAESARSRRAAAAFVSSIQPSAMEDFLASLPRAAALPQPAEPEPKPTDAARRALLVKRLKERSRRS